MRSRVFSLCAGLAVVGVVIGTAGVHTWGSRPTVRVEDVPVEHGDDGARPVATAMEPGPTPPNRSVVPNAVVTRHVDGDTIGVGLFGDGHAGARKTADDTDGGHDADLDSARDLEPDTVRLLGIDSPETHKPGVPVECFGHEAAAALASLVPVGTAIRLSRDREARDRYGRLLGYVHRAADGAFINEMLLEQGYAAPLTLSPNYAHSDELHAAAQRARGAGRGLWASCGGPHSPRADPTPTATSPP